MWGTGSGSGSASGSVLDLSLVLGLALSPALGLGSNAGLVLSAGGVEVGPVIGVGCGRAVQGFVIIGGHILEAEVDDLLHVDPVVVLEAGEEPVYELHGVLSGESGTLGVDLPGVGPRGEVLSRP